MQLRGKGSGPLLDLVIVKIQMNSHLREQVHQYQHHYLTSKSEVQRIRHTTTYQMPTRSLAVVAGNLELPMSQFGIRVRKEEEVGSGWWWVRVSYAVLYVFLSRLDDTVGPGMHTGIARTCKQESLTFQIQITEIFVGLGTKVCPTIGSLLDE